jgi:diacylglycerol kinase
MKNQLLLAKLGFAYQGFIFAVRSEANMRRHLVLALLAVIGFTWLQPSLFWWALMILCIGLVFAAELANSAIEALIYHLHPAIHLTIGHIKDMLAAMVLVLSIAAFLIGVLAILSSSMLIMGG